MEARPSPWISCPCPRQLPKAAELLQILSPQSCPPLFLSSLPSSAGETINIEQRKLICGQSVLIRKKRY